MAQRAARTEQRSAPSPAPRASRSAAHLASAAAGQATARARHEDGAWEVSRFVRRLASATPIEMVEIERDGVPGSFVKELSRRLQIPASRMFHILGIAKATAEKKAANGEMVTGSGGLTAVGMVKLLAVAEDIVARSTAREAKGFDVARWLGQWLERPQPALGGRRPADLVGTPTGLEVVARLLGSIESGAYQ